MQKGEKMGFSQWTKAEGTLWGILWRWKGSKEDSWCIELFTTRNGWLHSTRHQVVAFGQQQQIFVFEIPVGEFFARAHTDYPRLPFDKETIYEEFIKEAPKIPKRLAMK